MNQIIDLCMVTSTTSFGKLYSQPTPRKGLYNRYRYHYTHARNSFEIKIPTLVYETLRCELHREIYRWILGVEKTSEGDDKRICNAAMSVRFRGLKTIQYRLAGGVRDAKTPDASFYCRGFECKCWFPNLVIEIG